MVDTWYNEDTKNEMMDYVEEHYKECIEMYESLMRDAQILAEEYLDRFEGNYSEPPRVSIYKNHTGELFIHVLYTEIDEDPAYGYHTYEAQLPISYLWTDWIEIENQERGEEKEKEAAFILQQIKEAKAERYKNYLKLKEEFE